MAAGKVITGYSLPYVALYANSSGTVSYSSGQKLARGVDVSIEAESADDNKFYADNRIAESVSGVFTSGSVTLTVDGLKNTAEKLIMGLPTPTSTTVGTSSVNVYHYGDDVSVPYVGIGFIIQLMEEGEVSYRPFVLPKCQFQMPAVNAATQGEQIDWQTQKLTATILRSDATGHDWKLIGEDQDTEAEAEAVVKALLGITST